MQQASEKEEAVPCCVCQANTYKKVSEKTGIENEVIDCVIPRIAAKVGKPRYTETSCKACPKKAMPPYIEEKATDNGWVSDNLLCVPDDICER
eukprot:6463676-Lingulodinium_polyedra.AAC.2